LLFGSERGLGLACVEPGLEVLSDRLAARENRVVAEAAGRELDETDVVIPLPVAARVRCGLVERSQTVALPPP
jgi:hypothetical protein